MNKQRLLKVINPLLAIVFISQAVTGLGHEHIRHEVFEKVHSIGGLLLVLLVAIHLILNWSWVRNTLFKRGSTKQ